MFNSEKILPLILLFFVATVVFFVATIDAQSTPPSFPSIAVFSGRVEINGEYAPKGTVVAAKISGNRVGSSALGEDGHYTIVVEGTHEDSGTEIDFYINNVKADQTAEWEAGDINLDLSVSIPPEKELTSTSTTLSGTSTTSTTSKIPTSSTPSTSAGTIADITLTSTLVTVENIVILEETTTIKQPPSESPSPEFNSKPLLIASFAFISLMLLTFLISRVRGR